MIPVWKVVQCPGTISISQNKRRWESANGDLRHDVRSVYRYGGGVRGEGAVVWEGEGGVLVKVE